MGSILIVEDNEIVREALYDGLKTLMENGSIKKREIRIADSLTEAKILLASVRKIRFCIIDKDLPGKDLGLVLISELLEKETIRPESILFVSGAFGSEHYVFARNRGIHILEKPYSLKAIVEIINSPKAD